jgi:acetyl esterase/lipase
VPSVRDQENNQVPVHSNLTVHLLVLVTLVMLPGCVPRDAAEFFLLGGHVDLTPDIPYGNDPRQRLDVYQPERGQPAPVVVFLYGGRWQHGSKRDYRLLGGALIRQDIVAVIPDYRLYPEVRFPGWVEDAAHVVRWVRDSIGRFGGDPSQIFVVGHSSGAHTTALLALDEHYLRDVGLSPKSVRGFVSLAGPVATTWTDPDVQRLMGPAKGWPDTYPMEQVDGTEAPMLLLHGAMDHVVSAANSARLAARIRGRGGCARLKIYRGLGHVAIVLALSLPQLDIAPVLDEVTRFIADLAPHPQIGTAYSASPAVGRDVRRRACGELNRAD